MKKDSDKFSGFNDYKELAELLPQIVYETDPYGNITYTNHVAFELFRYPLDTPFEDLNIINMIIPEDRDRSLRNFEMALTNRTIDTIEYTGLRKDGTTFPMKIFSSPIIKDGEIKGLRGIIVDITLEKKMETITKESEERFYSLFDNMGSCCIILKAVNNGEDFIVIDINSQAESFSKLNRSTAKGESLKNILFRFKDSDIINVLKRVWTTGNEERYPYVESEKNKIIFWIDSHVFKLPSGELALVYDNITDAENNKYSLKVALQDKDILIREIHHRVKNNMQIISSLLNLQESFVKQNLDAIDILLESQNRVRSMALIHERLYESNNLTEINIHSYIVNLIEELLYSYGVKGGLSYNLYVDDVVLGIETATPLGLIITELVSNSLKYAYNQGADELVIGLKKYGEYNYILTIHDNGPGLPSNLDFENSKTLGLILVNSLVEQIEGQISVNCDSGTEFNIIFQELDYEKRL